MKDDTAPKPFGCTHLSSNLNQTLTNTDFINNQINEGLVASLSSQTDIPITIKGGMIEYSVGFFVEEYFNNDPTQAGQAIGSQGGVTRLQVNGNTLMTQEALVAVNQLKDELIAKGETTAANALDNLLNSTELDERAREISNKVKEKLLLAQDKAQPAWELVESVFEEYAGIDLGEEMQALKDKLVSATCEKAYEFVNDKISDLVTRTNTGVVLNKAKDLLSKYNSIVDASKQAWDIVSPLLEQLDGSADVSARFGFQTIRATQSDLLGDSVVTRYSEGLQVAEDQDGNAVTTVTGIQFDGAAVDFKKNDRDMTIDIFIEQDGQKNPFIGIKFQHTNAVANQLTATQFKQRMTVDFQVMLEEDEESKILIDRAREDLEVAVILLGQSSKPLTPGTLNRFAESKIDQMNVQLDNMYEKALTEIDRSRISDTKTVVSQR